MNPCKINAVEMVRCIRNEQYEAVKNMSDAEKIEFYRQKAQALMRRLGKAVKGNQQVL